MKLPEQQPLTLYQLSTKHLRTLAASAGLENADNSRPALLASLQAKLPQDSKQQWVIQDAEVSMVAYITPSHFLCDLSAQKHLAYKHKIANVKTECNNTQIVPNTIMYAMQGSAPGRMKSLLVSHDSYLYLYGGMPHTAFTQSRNAASANFAYPGGDTVFMKLSPSVGSKWQSVSCEGAVPESRTRIHSGHAGQSLVSILSPDSLPSVSPSVSRLQTLTVNLLPSVPHLQSLPSAPCLQSLMLISPWFLFLSPLLSSLWNSSG